MNSAETLPRNKERPATTHPVLVELERIIEGATEGLSEKDLLILNNPNFTPTDLQSTNPEEMPAAATFDDILTRTLPVETPPHSFGKKSWYGQENGFNFHKQFK